MVVQAKRLLAQKKAAAQKKQGSGAAAAAAREAKERAKKAKGKKDKSHFNQVTLASFLIDPESRFTRLCGLPAVTCRASLNADSHQVTLGRYAERICIPALFGILGSKSRRFMCRRPLDRAIMERAVMLAEL